MAGVVLCAGFEVRKCDFQVAGAGDREVAMFEDGPLEVTFRDIRRSTLCALDVWIRRVFVAGAGNRVVASCGGGESLL